MFRLTVVLFLCLLAAGLRAQPAIPYPALHLWSLNDTATVSTSLSKKRVNSLLIGGGALYAGSLYGFYHLWYKNYPQSHFHFFNDNDEWLQMDKAAHFCNSYYFGNLGYTSLRWAGMDDNKAIWLGGLSGSIYLSIIEILDGFSAGWGASYGDLLANTGGSFAYVLQQKFRGKQDIRFKMSFAPSPYAKYRPDLLGSNLLQNTIKDYNGISCWMSFNLSMFAGNNERFPDWLCLSLGYSGDGMTGATSNPAYHNGQPIPPFDRKRQFMLSADIDLQRLPVKNKFLKSLCTVFSVLKIPFPALEYNKKQGMVFHPLYF